MKNPFTPPFAAFAAVCLVLAPAAASAAPARMLVELSHRDGTDPAPREGRLGPPSFLSDILVRTDGSFVRDGRTGILSRVDRVRVSRAASRARLRMERTPRPHCEAIPNTTMRLATRRGTITWLAPCSPLPDDTAMALVALITELTTTTTVEPTPTPTPDVPVTVTNGVVFSYDEMSMRSPMDSEQIVVYGDGRLVRSGATTQLAPSDLERIVQLARVVVPEASPHDARMACAAMLTGQATIDVPGRGRYQWSMPCGQPHASIGALLREARRLAPARPMQ